MARRCVKVKGARGSPVALVREEKTHEEYELPVIHNSFLKNGLYHDPHFPRLLWSGGYSERFAGAFGSRNLVIVQKDKDPVTLQRDGYVGVFRYDPESLDIDGLNGCRLTIIERYAEVRNRS